MRTLVTFVAMLLLLFLTVGEQPIAKETPEGWDDPSSAHPWGGDETPDLPGDGTSGDRPSVGDRTANSISTTGNLYLDYLMYRFVYQPWLKDADTQKTRSTYRKPSATTTRKYDSYNRQR